MKTDLKPDNTFVTRLVDTERWAVAQQGQELGLYPYFRSVQSSAGNEITVEGERRLNLASNNYLSLSTDQRVVEAAREAGQRYGSGVGGSRFLNGTLDLHLELEEEVRDFYGAERALVTTTGYGANHALLTGLLGKEDVALVDEEAHNSIHSALVLARATVVRFPHNDTEELARKLADIPRETGKVIVVDGVYSMRGDLAPIPRIAELRSEFPNTILVVDEAHGLGVCGRHGRGGTETLGALDDVDFITVTFSKSLGSCGGAFVGHGDLIDVMQYCANMNPFVFTASNTPGSVAAALAALRILRSEPQLMERLRTNVALFRDMLEHHDLIPEPSGSAIVAVPLARGDDFSTLSAGMALLNAGVYANTVLYPAVERDGGLLRFSVMASHTEDQLAFAADTLARVLRDQDQL